MPPTNALAACWVSLPPGRFPPSRHDLLLLLATALAQLAGIVIHQAFRLWRQRQAHQAARQLVREMGRHGTRFHVVVRPDGHLELDPHGDRPGRRQDRR